MNIYRRNLNYLCRACLAELDKTKEKYNLYETEFLQQWFTMVTSLPLILDDDELPQFLCASCYLKLQEFEEFRNMMLRSHRILGDMLQLALEIETINKKRDIVRTEQHTKVLVDASAYENYEWLEFQDAGIDEVDIRQEEPEQCMQEEANIQMDAVREILKADDLIVEEAFEEIAVGVEDQDYKVQQFEEDASATDIANLSLNNHTIDPTTETNKQIDNGRRTRNEEDFEEIDYYEEEEADCLSSQETTVSNKQCGKNVKNSGTASKRGDIKFYCEKCSHRWFLSQENLDAHKRTHDGLRPFACKECQRSFNLSTQLRVHMREDHSDNPKKIECPYDGCDKWFTKSGSLKTHMRNKHARYTPYICEDCGCIFNNSFAFREHRYKHTSETEYPFQCEQCDKRFAAKSRYMRHLVRHTGVKSFECPHCDMKKYTRDELNAHLNTHTKEKLWTCKYCPKVFTTSTNWRIHEQTVHKGIRKFNCRYCEQTFGRPHTRKRHEMIHTGERPCVCHICDKRFIQAATLKAHIKTHDKHDELIIADFS